MEKVTYIDRVTQAVEEEVIYGKKALSLFYGTGWFSRWMFFLFHPLIFKLPLFSKIYGFLQKREKSVKKIAPFIQKFQLDTKEFTKKEFLSFNDFFTRKLKSNARPIEMDPNIIVLPADGRYSIYPKLHAVDHFFVKGNTFDLSKFLQDDALVKTYAKGAMVIARLCPVDYHRFHFPVDCIASQPIQLNGYLYSVSLPALKKNIGYLSENKRYLTKLKTKDFGEILYVEIGATNVGTVHQTFSSNAPCSKGEEKGYFSFGGSCIVLLFEPDQVVFDRDLLFQPMEVKGLMGQSLARKRTK